MVSIQNYSAITPNVAFKAREDKNSAPSDAPQSHAGLKTGAVWTAIAAPIGLGLAMGGNKITQNAVNSMGGNDSSAFIKMAQKANLGAKTMKYTLPLNIAIALGCGALVDKLNNDKRAKFAEELAQKGKKATLADNDNAEETRAGNVYCKSGEGKKWGPLLGMTALVGVNLLTMLFTNVKGYKQPGAVKFAKIIGLADSVISGAIGGLALGAIADHFSNKTAEKHANKLARSIENQNADKAETPKADDVKEASETKEVDNDKKAEKE